MTLTLPPTIAAYFEADNVDNEALVNCFAPDAVVKDEGHTYRGHDEIRAWRTGAAAKYTYTCEPLRLEEDGPRTVVTCHLVGDFPGSPVDLRFIFQLAEEKIVSLEIVF